MESRLEPTVFASRLREVPTLLDRGRFWGLAFARSGERVAYVTHALGFCQMLESDLAGRERRAIVSLEGDEVISEVHGWGRDDRYLVLSVTARGRTEIRAVEVANRTMHVIATESFFGGWDDAHDAFFVWDRQTGSRRVLRATISGRAVVVDAGHVDRRIARSADGRTVYFSEKFLADPADKRFTIYRAEDGRARVPIAMIATTCRTSRLALALSPDGRYLHVSALGHLEECGEPASFDLVIATDGSHRRLVPVKGWVSADRAVIPGRGRGLDVVDPATGSRRPLVLEAVDQFTTSADGTAVAFTSGGSLFVVSAPA